jgi:hypothetical protein
MNLRKLPPSMLLALGLACTPEGEGSDAVSTCLLYFPPDGTSSTSTSGSTTSADVGTSPCLKLDLPQWETSTSACLEPPWETGFESSSGSDTGTGSGTGSGSDSGSGSGTDGTTTVSACLVPPDAPPGDSSAPYESTLAPHAADSRRQALERLLDRGTLPADVAARLRGAREAE